MMGSKTLSRVRVERRTLVREASSGRAVLCLKNGVVLATLRDISTRGLGVVLSCEPETPSHLVVELFDKTGHFWHRKGVQVIHVTPRGDGTWLMGSVFLQEFTPEEVQAILG
jgi:hypothetical protein